MELPKLPEGIKKFERLMEQLIEVPKSELEAEMKKWDAERKKCNKKLADKGKKPQGF